LLAAQWKMTLYGQRHPGYRPGSSVLVEELEGGELRIVPTEQVRDRIRSVGRRVVSEHSKALKIIAEHDPAARKRRRR
jgi:hypothetical protein